MAPVLATTPLRGLKRKRSPSQIGRTGVSMSLVGNGTMTHAGGLPRSVSSGTSVKSAAVTTGKELVRSGREMLEWRARRPRYARELMWGEREEEISPAALYSFTAEPLPGPPASELNNEDVTKTLFDHPDLFKIICAINVDVFETLLADHPNRPFVVSVLHGL